ncbi:MAG TPA: RNA polymerase [Bacteroidales bacterium]|nr:RNA polymerase [Bacteroidales bacterium]
MDEKQLLKDCLSGKVHAQKRLYDLYARKMYGICLRYASDHSMAEDFLQEGFIRVFVKLGSYKFKGSFEGWVRRIMINTSLEILRKNDVLRFSIELNPSHEIPGEEEPVSEQIDINELMKHIQEMPTGFRTVFNLFAVENLSHKEIGKMLRISEGTSKSQYARARAWLQKRLSANE